MRLPMSQLWIMSLQNTPMANPGLTLETTQITSRRISCPCAQPATSTAPLMVVSGLRTVCVSLLRDEPDWSSHRNILCWYYKLGQSFLPLYQYAPSPNRRSHTNRSISMHRVRLVPSRTKIRPSLDHECLAGGLHVSWASFGALNPADNNNKPTMVHMGLPSRKIQFPPPKPRYRTTEQVRRIQSQRRSSRTGRR